MNEEITFLIGAGAETGRIYGLPSGGNFKANIVKNDNLKEIFSIFNKNTVMLVDNQKILKHNATSTLYQTIKENLNEYNDYSTKLSLEDVNVIKEYLDYKSGNNSEENSIVSTRFRELYYKKIYNSIIENKENNPIKDFYLKHLSFCSFVDSYFNFLRNVDLYTKECSRVIKLYYSAFQTIVFNIGNIKERNNILTYTCIIGCYYIYIL